MEGTVKWFSDEKGYGFIAPDGPDESDVFVHFTGIAQAPGDRSRRNLVEGARVAFETEEGRNGRVQATAVTTIGEAR